MVEVESEDKLDGGQRAGSMARGVGRHAAV